MKKLYQYLSFLLALFYLQDAHAQTCNVVIQSAVPNESRCKATGSIQVVATGGTGNYNYRVTGPINTPYSSSSLISGLQAGTYTVMVQDVTSNCVAQTENIVVSGSYEDPRFNLEKTDETCLNARNATITVINQTGGRGPYTFTIVAPSPASVGTSNQTGTFSGLPGGEYAIELKDSCGGIQTRRVNVLAYDWWIESHTGARTNCRDGNFQIRVRDSRGNINTSSSVFSSFTYGAVNSPGDTVWHTNYQFTYPLQSRRSLRLVAKDGCGNVRQVNWVDNQTPSVASVVAVSYQSCNSFTASITGQTNLTNPSYCLYNNADVEIACNSTGVFAGIQVGTYRIRVRDLCFDTTINRNFVVNPPAITFNPTVSLNRTGCNETRATVSNLTNFTNPTFCLYNGAGTQLSCNSTGVFSNLANGAYCVRVQDGCYDTTIQRCFNIQAPVPAVAASVTISDPQCADADVSITGQTNLTNPQFCLYNESNVLVACNTNGNFGNVPYGSYCMRIVNDAACYDTTIQRCFTIRPIPPSVNTQLNVSRYCNTIDLSVGGQSNLTNAQFCLYDATNTLVSCNANGTFTNLPYGFYCMEIRNDQNCYDTTIRRCITVTKNVPQVGNIQVGTRGCNGFNMSINGLTNWNNPTFTLRNSGGTVIGTNSTGNFSNVPYGNYCMEVRNNVNCYDTTITRCITVSQIQPSVGNVQISNRTCAGFNARVQNVQNFNSPTYTLRTAGGDLVATNTNGQFGAVPYGSYCVSVRDNCYDTTINRCFDVERSMPSITLQAQPSCELNNTNIRVTASNGFAPYTVRVYNPADSLMQTVSSGASSINVNGLPGLPGSQQYRVELTDNCGSTATRMVTPATSTFNSSIQVTSKCPSGANQNGSSEVTVTVTSNLGVISPTIIRRNGATVNMPYNTGSVSVYKWTDLSPATYVIQYNLPGSCNNKGYDTVIVSPYQYPQLDKSASYQCDNNSFSVGADVTGGAPPYMYEVIGSVPASPSIVAPPQASPIFNISNGSSYSLVRLRVVDHCGNATLNDVSVLPLQNTVVTAQSDCYYTDVTLTVPYFANASYEWYKRNSSDDSVLVSNNNEYTIPYLEPDAIGEYVAKITVNNGCLVRLNYYTVTGSCGGVLSSELKLTGKHIRNIHQLNWNHLQAGEIVRYQVERQKANGSSFDVIGDVSVIGAGSSTQFSYTDEYLVSPMHQYRIKAIDRSGKVRYSNLVKLNHQAPVQAIRVYPNPVNDVVNILFQAGHAGQYQLELSNAGGQVIYQTQRAVNGAGLVTIARAKSMAPGIYFLRIRNASTGTETIEKLLFQ